MRPTLFLLIGLLAAGPPALAQMPKVPGLGAASGALTGGGLGGPGKRLLAQASDEALDKLSRPGAFAADSSVRITLPGPAGAMGAMSGMMNMAGKAGMGGDVTGALNTAAGQAASAAKPIFRAAIDKMTLQDAMGLTSDTGATDYLRKSAGEQIRAELAPLVRSALAGTGILSRASSLSAIGMNETTLVDYVTSKTADGIYAYMRAEERRLRQNPMGAFGH